MILFFLERGRWGLGASVAHALFHTFASLALPPHPLRRFLRWGIGFDGFFFEKSAEVKGIKKKKGDINAENLGELEGR